MIVRTLLLVLFLSTMWAVTPSASAATAPGASALCRVTAHRGNTGVPQTTATENGLTAFHRAVAAGADYLETDVSFHQTRLDKLHSLVPTVRLALTTDHQVAVSTARKYGTLLLAYPALTADYATALGDVAVHPWVENTAAAAWSRDLGVLGARIPADRASSRAKLQRALHVWITGARDLARQGTLRESSGTSTTRTATSGLRGTASARAQVVKPACTWSWWVSSLNHCGADPSR